MSAKHSKNQGPAPESAESLKQTLARLERELEIEAALERVRAASLAMHQSSELQTVVNTLFEQVKSLNIPLNSASIFILEEGKKDWQQWVATDTTAYSTYFHLPYGNFKVQRDFQQAREKGLDFYTAQYNRQQKNSWFQHAFANTGYRSVPKERQGYMLASDRLIFSVALQQHIALQLAKYEGEPFTEAENHTLTRFARVFDQTYTRFLDLKKAEAQAREAQIEAALERVRARSMAMYQSSELNIILAKVFEELTSLEIEMERAVIWIYHPENRSVHWWAANPEAESGSESYFISDQDDPVYIEYWKAWEERRTKYLYILEGDYKENWTRILFNETELKRLPEVVKTAMVRPEKIYLYNTFNDFGVLFIACLEPLPDEKFSILERFGKVFDQSYTRFLDIQKAEAQAREAEVQLALERVRAATMAMHNSEELSEVAAVLFRQMNELGVTPERVNIGIVQEQERVIEYWSTEQGGKQIDRLFKAGIDEPTTISKLYAGWKAAQPIFELHQTGKELTQWLRHLKEVLGMPFDENLRQQRRVQTAANFKHGMLLVSTPDPVSAESKTLMHRFAGVFEQTYTRFLDLQKAEAQAREAQIEAALERVRAKTMAMHQSQELQEVINTVYGQLLELKLDITGGAFIVINSEIDSEIVCWGAGGTADYLEKVHLPYMEMPIYTELVEGIKKGPGFFTESFSQDEKRYFFQELFRIPPYNRATKQWKKEVISRPGGYTRSCVVLPYTSIFIINHHGRPFSEEDNDILKRMGKVFEQTYTRFLDLQKAEAQAREAQIEAALERVRAKTMAMHHTDDIAATVGTFFNELIGLGLDETLRCGIGILSQSALGELWTASENENRENTVQRGLLEMSGHPLLQNTQTTWERGEPGCSMMLKGEAVRAYYRHISQAPDYPVTLDPDKAPEALYHNGFHFQNGSLFAFTPMPLPDEIRTILERFAAVFGQTYTRYLDLQKAEQRAREAQIEAALERVRAKTMAMHNTDDIAATVTTFFNELLSLDPDASLRCGVGILSQSQRMQLWTASVRDASQTVLHAGTLDMSLHPLLQGAKANWARQGPPFSYALKGADLKRYFQVLNEAPDYPARFDLSAIPKEVYHNSFVFRDGLLFVFTDTPLPNNDIRNILERFASVFGQTYTRYLDLQKAEQRAREAIKQASIERVRGEIASMRSTADLSRITPLVWNELTTLGVPFFRCGVFIVDEKERKIHSYLSNPKGESLAVWHAGFGLIPLFDEMVASWKKQEVFLTEWDRQGFLDFSKTLMDHGLVDNRERYQSGADAPEHLVLHMVPFAQGMLYVGSQVHLDQSHMELVRALASAFSVAYARYEDFNQLEKALTELKATQAQLIQSEKMASLGELTAGIAHEIQNPLNFVNNFSEVSAELLEELMEELQKGDWEEAKALAEDITQNLQKIVHHGKRADGIVKGMLQHSRSSDGKKEPTDLNALADEYLRLAYHGLRAKDKSFNATLESHFDPGIGQLEMVPQEIGRVILNLLTNAFYAVSEKAREGQNGYVPTVAIKTYREDGRVVVSVSDNANGIPEKVLEKIFQPFFTTKPTGEGTGLGLSMSYDIVRAHGGDLEVQTREGSGTTFFIKFKPGI